MNNGLTGLNLSKAADDIGSFASNFTETKNSFGLAFENLYAWLNDHWASENAVAYTTKNSKEINETMKAFDVTGKHIVNGAIDAAKNLASANGEYFSFTSPYATPIDTETQPLDSIYTLKWVLPCTSNINGVSGIDVEGAKFVLTTFELQMKKALSMLDAMPDGIAFYDPDGTMVGKYDRNIKDFKQQFENLLTSMKADITGYLDTEVNNVLMAKNKAVDSMTA